MLLSSSINSLNFLALIIALWLCKTLKRGNLGDGWMRNLCTIFATFFYKFEITSKWKITKKMKIKAVLKLSGYLVLKILFLTPPALTYILRRYKWSSKSLFKILRLYFKIVPPTPSVLQINLLFLLLLLLGIPIRRISSLLYFLLRDWIDLKGAH